MKLTRRIDRLLPRSRRWERQEIRLKDAYARDVAKAREEKDRDKIHELENMNMVDLQVLREEQDAALTQDLLRQARKLRVPVPPRMRDNDETGYWARSMMTMEVYLTPKGIKKIREEIRAEERWRHERRSHWVPWITALTGLAGTIIGILAILGL